MAVSTNRVAVVGDGSVIRFSIGTVTTAPVTTVTTAVNTNDLGIIQSIGASLTHETVDVTALDSGGVKQYISGLRDATLSFEVQVDHNNTMHNDIILAAGSGQVKLFAIMPNDSTGMVPAQSSYTGSGYITDATMTMPTGDKQTMSVSVQVTGGVTVTVT